MKTKFHEVNEQETGVYVFPDPDKFEYSWAIWLNQDGSADVYNKRNQKTGALLGKPIRLPAPIRKNAFKWCKDTACPLKDFQEHEFGKGCRLY